MFRTLDSLLGYSIHAIDGDLGKVHDFFFDDETWTVRYLVVETGGWLRRKRVLLSPSALAGPDWSGRKIPVNLTKDQVAKSPDVDMDKPVSRQQELSMNLHYGWPAYWAVEPFLMSPPGAVTATADEPAEGDPHLRSFREVSSYRAEVEGKHVGFVEDMILDDRVWRISWIVVALGEWLPRRPVLMDRDAVRRISWVGKSVDLRPPDNGLEHCLPFDMAAVETQQAKGTGA